MLDKTADEAYSIDAAIPNSHNLHREAPEVERRAYENMATENGLRNTISTIHNGYYPKQITQILTLLNLCPGQYIF